tara:strand:+ start:466 stop:624 length:159 start_codon:yes stop_codon:yes gene_type:complete
MKNKNFIVFYPIKYPAGIHDDFTIRKAGQLRRFTSRERKMLQSSNDFENTLH